MEKLKEQRMKSECELTTGIKSGMVKEGRAYPAMDMQDKSFQRGGDNQGPKALLNCIEQGIGTLSCNV